MKCPIRKDKVKFAIKQNSSNYSPGFGETNVADLFIAYKNLANSYSNLGNVYTVPANQDKDVFLAGRNKDWQIEEVEVWQVSWLNRLIS